MIDKLIGSSADLLTLFHSINDVFIATDNEFKVTFWNKSAEKIYGYSALEMTGKVTTEVIPTEFVDTTREDVIATAMATGHWTGEVIQTTKTGRKVHMECSTRMLKDEEGNMTSIVTINRDITDIVEVREMKKSLVGNSDKSPASLEFHEHLQKELARLRHNFLTLVTHQKYTREEDIQLIDEMVHTINQLSALSKKMVE